MVENYYFYKFGRFLHIFIAKHDWHSGLVQDLHSIDVSSILSGDFIFLTGDFLLFFLLVTLFFYKQSDSNACQIARSSIKWRYVSYNTGPKVFHPCSLFFNKFWILNWTEVPIVSTILMFRAFVGSSTIASLIAARAIFSPTWTLFEKLKILKMRKLRFDLIFW